VPVQGTTGAAVQTAITDAAPDDVLYLPGGDYLFTQTVTVSKPLTICGAAELQNVAVMEAGTEVPPTWSGTPSRCYAETHITLLSATSDNVKLVGLKVEGIATTSGTGIGIKIAGHDNLTVSGCEAAHHMEGVAFSQSKGGLVQASYLHDNHVSGMGYGVVISGTSMAQGGSRVVMRQSEFAGNRHDIASNSPDTRWLADHCYFRDNYQGSGFNQPAVDAHPQGDSTLRLTVRNSRFKNTRPMGMKCGIWELTNNHFDSSCGSVINEMILIGAPTHNGNVIPTAASHDIYIGENVNQSGKALAKVLTWSYPPTKWVAYNLFVDGVLWEAANTTYPPLATSPKPLVGHIYVTPAGGTEVLETITRDTWYDLHLMAVDAQGSSDIAVVGAQLLAEGKAAHDPDLVSQGAFSSADSYYLRFEGTSAFSRETDGSSQWTKLTAKGLYLDPTASSWAAQGSHRVHVKAKFRLLLQAAPGAWRIYGLARDKSNNLPISAWLADQEGWPIAVK